MGSAASPRRVLVLVVLTMAAVLVSASPAGAAVGDLRRSMLTPEEVQGATNFCSIGIAFDGKRLYYDRCGDGMIYRMTVKDQDGDGDAEPKGGFPSGIAELPNAMAYDGGRNGLWIGTQRGNQDGDMPIYFHDFDTDETKEKFVVDASTIVPATGGNCLSFSFDDGLAFDARGKGAKDDRIWFSDDVNNELCLYKTNGEFVRGYNAATVDPSLALTSGVAVGGPLLYLGNNGGGEVFRTAKNNNPLEPGQSFAALNDRVEDMECDNTTFKKDVIWVRSTPQGNRADDLVSAFEIERNTCGIGGRVGDGVDPDVGAGNVPDACVRSAFQLRVRIDDDSAMKSVKVLLDGDLIKKTKKKSFDVKVRAGKLLSGGHRLVVKATDSFGNRTAEVRRFRRCPRQPDFTGKTA